MYKIIFYAPESHVEQIKNAMFAKGAGRIGEYDSCAWQVLGEGQFKPLDNSNAFIGEKNKLEKVMEYKVELVTEQSTVKEVIAAMKAAHPYETPAYQVFRLEDF